MMALAALLLGTSCSNDELSEPTNGQPMTANFSVQLPTGISARKVANGAKKAFADGKTATKLKYMVFDNDNKLIEGLGGEKDINLTANVQMQLTTGKTYKIVFWAANADAPYTLDDNGVVTVDYTNIKANDESLDAFYRCYTYKAGDDVENPIKLYRPFAQLNVGTNDMEAATKTGFNKDAAKTEVKVSGIANKLDLLDGSVSGEAEVTCSLNAIPQGETFPKAGYDYLSMDYLLVGKEAKSNVNVAWKITDGANTINRTFANVPVQGNYRTNIYGALLTSTTDMNVEINPAFAGDDNEYPFVEPKLVSNQNELKDALQTEGAAVKLAPNTTYDMPASVANNTKIYGASGAVLSMQSAVAYHDKNVTFEDVTLESLSGKDYVGIQHANNVKFINSVIKGKIFSYATNAEFIGCTFEQDAEDYNIWTYGSKNITFTNCKFNCQGKSVLIYSEQKDLVQKATFNNCQFTASKGSFYKGAIEIDSGLLTEGGYYDVYINNCTHSGFSYSKTIYHVKKGNNANIWLDGTQVVKKG